MIARRWMNHGMRWFGFVATICMVAGAATPKVATFAGGGLGDGGVATLASLAGPADVVRDGEGNIYIADATNCRVRRVTPGGIIGTVAGTGICGYSGDGGPAKSAKIAFPEGLSLDREDNLLISLGDAIRKVTPTGIITTIAGNGRYGYSGDGGPATEASLSGTIGVFADPSGKIYIAESGNNVVRMVDAAGIIHTVAGNHTSGFSGDGGPATSASLNFPWGVVADGQGNFYIADANNARVRRVDSSGTITTYAGNGSYGFTGSGGPATSAAIGEPQGLMLGGGKLYLSAGVIWAIDVATQEIKIIAGGTNGCLEGDGRKALSTCFSLPDGMAFDGAGGILVADTENNRIRDVDAKRIVSTVAGGNLGDGGLATQGSLNIPANSPGFSHMAFDPAGNFYIADVQDVRIRKVSIDGVITTIAGTGRAGYSGDGGPAAKATFELPSAVAADGNGNIYVADSGNEVIRKIDSTGTISTFVKFYEAPNLSETARAVALTVDGSGNLYASDGVSLIWKITPSGATSIVAGVITNVGYNGDGIPATQAWLNFPTGVAVDGQGNVYISDEYNSRIRKVNSSGIISTVAGNGSIGFSGDGGPATAASLFFPSDVAADGQGRIYVSDWLNFRVRVVNSAGIIETLAGSGGVGYNGEDLPDKKANIFPIGIGLFQGGVYVGDAGTYRVRKIQ